MLVYEAYIKSPGFIHYRNQLFEKLIEIRSLSKETYSSLSHCDEGLVENFMMNRMGMDWLAKLMKEGNRFDFGNIRIFAQGDVEDMVDQMLANRYLRRNNPNLEHLDEIIENLKDNVPVVISGKITDNDSRIPLRGARISADVPMLFENASCVRNVTTADGTFTILLSLPLAYEGKLDFTATYKGIRSTESLEVNIQQTKRYEVNFFLDTGKEEIDQLVMTPQNVFLKIGESIDFNVLARYADGREVNVTTQAMNSATFNAVSAGQFTVSASYREKEASAVVTVVEDNAERDTTLVETEPATCDEATQRWNAESGRCECLPHLLENSEGKCVAPEELEKELAGEEQCDALSKELILLIEAARQLNNAYVDNYRIFNLHHDRFFKEINDQASEVCDNQMIGFTYYTAIQAAGKMNTLEEGLVSILIDITYTTTVCPDLNTMLNNNGFGSDITKWVEFFDVVGALASMADRLTEFGCNTDDVAQSGEEVAPGELDPTFVGKGGTSTEISGDGKDNDGDGLQDEIPVAGLPGYNITIALYDSGSAKDDVFSLSVIGLGSIGLTPAGGLRTYGLNLPRGTYTAEVLVVVAPDDIGTFTINILQNGISIGSLTGEPGEGSVSTLMFEVTE